MTSSNTISRRIGIFAAAVIFGAITSSLMLFFPKIIPAIVKEDLDDRFVSWFATRPITQRTDIVVVLLQPELLRKYASQDPIDRSLLAQILRTIDVGQPRTIGLDIYFNSPTEAEKDEDLAQSIRSLHSRVVLTSLKESPTEGHAGFPQEFAARIESPLAVVSYDSDPDLDTPVRRVSPEGEHAFSSSFVESLIQASFATGIQQPPIGMIDWLAAPLDGSDVFLTISAEKLLNGARPENTNALLGEFRDKIVLVGSANASSLYKTPMSLLTNERMPKAMIDAHVTAQVLDGRRIWELSPLAASIINAALAAAFFLITYRYNLGKYACLIKATLAFVFLIICGLIFGVTKIFLPIAPLAVACAAGITGGYIATVARDRWPIAGAS